MSIAELILYYVNLLVLQYREKPKARETIATIVDPAVMDMLPIDVQDAFELGSAVGKQLDVLGKYCGVTRFNNSFAGPVTLNDSDFLSLIKVAVLQNNAGSSLSVIQNLINTFFPGDILVFDYSNMRIGYFLTPAIGSAELAQVFITSGILPKPMGVQLSATIYSPNIYIFFGMRTYYFPAANVTPFNNYTSYNMNYPWLSYQDAFTQ